MLIQLKSDFRDYYDHVFSGSWQVTEVLFERLTTGGPGRREMFDLMMSLKLTVPLHGTVTELNAKLIGEFSYLGNSKLIDDYMRNLTDVVVYLDEQAHQGGGKVKLNIREALLEYPDHFASQFIPSNAVTLRYLRVGRRQFWLRYSSKDDWRSNVGDVSIELLCEETPKTLEDVMRLRDPLVAIDFVKADKLYAIDYNIAPGLKGTGLEDLLTPAAVFDELTCWFQCKNRCLDQV